MQNRLLVSAIIPVYNGERYLAEAIASVLAQTYRPIEIIIVDDGSVDGTANIAKSYKKVRYIYQTNQGHGMAKNAGIAAARGEFLAFLDADDIWTPNKLRVQMDYLIDHPDVGYAVARMRVFLEPGTEWPLSLNKDHYSKDPVGFIPGTLVARKTVFKQIGAFDTSYRHGNDSDWFFRAKDASIPMAILPQVLLHKRIHSSNLSHEIQTMTSEVLRVVRSSVARKRHQKPAQERDYDTK